MRMAWENLKIFLSSHNFKVIYVLNVKNYCSKLLIALKNYQ